MHNIRAAGAVDREFAYIERLGSAVDGGSGGRASSNGGGTGAAGSAEASFLVCYDHFGHGQEVYCVRGSL